MRYLRSFATSVSVTVCEVGCPLVACLTAAGTVRTPGQAHARCMAALTRHLAAITPRYYVICRTTPSDPAAWPAPLA